jgi:hypothetical protein
MSFWRHLFFLTLLLPGLCIKAQQGYKGTIYDISSKETVPFATIKVNGRDDGVIANEDGRFFIPAGMCQRTDSLTISCVGYLSRKLMVKMLRDSSRIGLRPVIYDLKEISVTAKGNPEYLHRLFFETCQKYRKLENRIYSKAYFAFLSECNAEPLEIIEAFYNAQVCPAEGVSLLLPKNGRIGLTLRNFWSLNTTDILTHIRPFSSGGDATVPEMAGNMTYHRFRDQFLVNLVKYSDGDEGRQYILKLLPKYDSLKQFETKVWLNEKRGSIDRMECRISDLDFFYLRSRVKGDRIDSVSLFWSADLDNDDPAMPRFSRISLDYSLVYVEKTDSRKTRLQANAELIFYDYGRPFLGVLGFPADLGNDYQRILCIPHDSLFWTNPGVTPESRKQERFRSFFRSNGVLLNYQQGLNTFVRSAFLPWTADRNLEFYEIGSAKASSKTVYIPAKQSVSQPKEPFSFLGSILINPIESGDSLRFGSSTMVNARESYFNERQSFRATAFLNVIFDMYELKRRELINQFQNMNLRKSNAWPLLKDRYEAEMVNLRDSIRLFSSESWQGSNADMILYWYNHIAPKLGIERTKLMQRMISEEQDKKKKKKNR